MKIFNILLLSTVLLIFSCKNNPPKVESTPEISKITDSNDKYILTPFSDSPGFNDAILSDMKFEDKKFQFKVTSDTYKLGNQTSDASTKMCANSAKGQHIHLIVNDQPYAAKYESSFDYEIEDGKHHLLAFLSRSYHESIKTDDAFIAKKAIIKDNSIVTTADIEDEMLFYSRPKGTYIGEDTKKVMLDFFLVNTEISPTGNKVIAAINGENHTITKWQPYYIEGLPMGTNSIKLTLVDKDGKLLPLPLNPVTREFTLMEDPTPTK